MSELQIVSKILVIYTGGTIGMVNSKRGYIPCGKIKDYLCTHPQYHQQDLPTDILVLPKSKFAKRIEYDIIEYEPLLDSSNMSHSDWLRIGKDIEKYYNDYTSFVILHGTDTMAYSASAVSFMLHNLGKTVIFTGAQISIREPLSDGHHNFLGALTLAGQYVIPEVTIFFNQQLTRGNCTIKRSASEYDAFYAPPRARLARVGIHIEVNWNIVYHNDRDSEPFYCADSVNPNIVICRIFPGITMEIMRNFMQPPVQGVILQAFGSGNAPDTSKAFLDVLKEASNRGVVICCITQCQTGFAEPSYAAGKSLLEAGVIFCMDMTCESAIGKLSKLIDAGISVEEVRYYMKKNLRGEITEKEKPIYDFFDAAVVNYYSQKRMAPVATIRSKLFPVIARSKGLLSGLKLLTDKSVEITDLVDFEGRTALHFASFVGDLSVVKFLCEEKEADIDARDKHGRRPIDLANMNQLEDIVSYFESLGVERDSRYDPVIDGSEIDIALRKTSKTSLFEEEFDSDESDSSAFSQPAEPAVDAQKKSPLAN